MATPLLAVLLQAGPKTVAAAHRYEGRAVAHLLLLGDELDPGLPALASSLNQRAPSPVLRVVALPGIVRVESEAETATAAVSALGTAVLSWTHAPPEAWKGFSDPIVQARWGRAPTFAEADPARSFREAARPGNTVVVVSSEASEQDLAGLVAEIPWPQSALQRFRKFEPLEAVLPGGVVALQWRGPALKPGEPEFLPTFMAACALGSGPAGMIRRVCRDTHAWSYDQDAVLWPTRAGYVSVGTVFLSSGSAPAADEVQRELETRIDAMDSSDLARTVRLARSALAGDPRWSPLLVGPHDSYGSDQASGVAWRGLTEVWGVVPHYPGSLAEAAGTVTLGQLQAACREFIAPGRRKMSP